MYKIKKKKKLSTLNIQNYIHYLKLCAVQCTKFCILFEKLITFENTKLCTFFVNLHSLNV